MKNYDIILILVSIFVVRIIAFSAGYADAVCLIGLLSFKTGKDYLSYKKIESEVMGEIQSQKDINQRRFEQMAEEIAKARVSSDGLKAAINLTKR